MKRLIFLSTLLFIVNIHLGFSQSVEIEGKIVSTSNVENIHVINKTKQYFTTTNKEGLFIIYVSINDTLQFSSIQHKMHSVIINDAVIASKNIFVNLKEQVNELDEVLVGKILTGDLASDLKNVEGDPPINFYDVGIPGYTGKIATQSERRLSEAGEFKPKMLLGALTGGISLNPILNGISGRTKMLKNRVAIESKETLIRSIKARLTVDFLASNPLKEERLADFFYFCVDDPNFLSHCYRQSDFKILIFLRKKYRQYQENIKFSED